MRLQTIEGAKNVEIAKIFEFVGGRRPEKNLPIWPLHL